MIKLVKIIFLSLIEYVKWIRYLLVYYKFRRYTMISKQDYVFNLELSVKFAHIQGVIVECGTWKGGMIAGIAKLFGNNRHYYLFDSFEGLPDAKEIDGESAISWQSDKTSNNYHDNCTASEQDATNAMKMAGISKPSIIKGWFNDSLPNARFEKGIAILRMDGDWYESTMDILNNLFHQVNKDGVIIIDDYYAWDGCSRAVHDYLSVNKCTERVRSHRGVCYIIKK